MQLAILSGGAAQGLVQALAARFKTETGCEIAGIFGAVGAMRDKLIAGEPADLVILTSSLVAELMASGHVTAGTARDIGVVRTAVAARAADPLPSIADAEALRAALLAADEIHLPDPKLATAGIHFAKVLAALGIGGETEGRLRPHPNGMTAMRALAHSTAKRPIGCTQVTEILATPGVTLAGPCPRPSNSRPSTRPASARLRACPMRRGGLHSYWRATRAGMRGRAQASRHFSALRTELVAGRFRTAPTDTCSSKARSARVRDGSLPEG
jgi:molybdate transport system substrate-binding protein